MMYIFGVVVGGGGWWWVVVCAGTVYNSPLKDRERESRQTEANFDSSDDTGIVAKMKPVGQTDYLCPLELLLLLLMIIWARKMNLIYRHVFEVRLIQNIHDTDITYDFIFLIYAD